MIKKIVAVLLILSALAVVGFFLFQGSKSKEQTQDVKHQEQDLRLVDIDGSELSLTENGTALRKAKGKNLPKIFLSPETTPAENQLVTDSKILFALTLVKNLTKSDFTPAQVRFVNDVDIIVHSQLEATALFTTTKDAVSQVDSLQSVLSKAKIDATKISQIDLRFNKPVVTYKK